MATDPLQPSATLLCKLGSVIVHADELTTMSVDAIRGHEHDKIVLRQLLADPEVAEWISQMDSMAMLPKKR